MTAEQALSAGSNNEIFDSKLVRLRARLLDLITHSKEKMLVLQDGPVIFNAHLDSTDQLSSALRVGSVLELTGVCSVQVDASRYPKSFQLHLRSPADLRVLKGAPWLTVRHTVGVLVMMSLIILAVVSWVMALRRRVRVQTALIEERIEREKALEMRTRITNILEKSFNEICIFDAETLRFEYVNPGALRNLGYSLAALQQMTPLDLNPEFTEAAFRKMVEPLLRGAKDKHVLHTIHRRANGSDYPVEVHLQKVDHSGKPLFLAVILDITERKRAEAELERAQKELLEVSRQAGMAEVATGVLHNVGNVLNSVNVSTTLVIDRLRHSKVGRACTS
ncbi:MAG: PAS domain S-box protein [Verrucomicrobiota bacterium]